MKTRVAHAMLLSPSAVYLYLYIYRCGVHIAGDPQSVQLAKRYNNNRMYRCGWAYRVTLRVFS